MTKVRYPNKSVQFRKSDITDGKRNLKLPRDKFYYEIGGEISKILTKDCHILQSFASVLKKYELADKGLQISILRANVIKIVNKKW